MTMILDAFVETFVERLVDLAEDRISMILGVKDDLKVLEFELRHLAILVASAESRRIREDSIRIWVADLREVLYDADDLLDDCGSKGNRLRSSSAAEAAATAASPSASSSSQSASSSSQYASIDPRSLLRYLVSFFADLSNRNKLGGKIRGINSQLKTLSKRTKGLQLVQMQRFEAAPGSVSGRPVPFTVHEEIVGIDRDAGELVDLVISGGGRLSIYAITGMPGIGKTTLAQKVFQDQQVKSYFDDYVIHLCVSKVYNRVNLLKVIGRFLKRKAGKPINDIPEETYEEATSEVSELIENKRVLLVLDDVWDTGVWEDLRFPLHSAADGSCVLVTTRNEGVAKDMNAQHTHRARKLTDKEGWLMLCKLVFGDETIEEAQKPLEKTGVEIVAKCKGLPLAIKTIAGVLRRKETNRTAWESVRDNSLWQLENLGEKINGTLLLSYQELRPHHKQCFLFCSLFPEDYRFHQEVLVQMWIAEDLVKPDGQRSLEDIGEDYYEELVMRNFLQAAPEYYKGRGCTMHDLFRAVGQYVSRSSSAKIRHLFFVNREEKTPPNVDDKESLRTIILSKNLRIKSISPDYFSKLTHLRVLDVEHTGIRTLPESLGDLVQLRFLNVAFTKIKQLPESIGKLLNLKTLKANNMKNLEALPAGITKLESLRYLEVGSAKKQLKSTPIGIGALHGLRTFRGFVVNDGTEQDMGELGKLPDIAHISMYKLEKVKGKEEAEATKLKDKRHLKFLCLSCATTGRQVEEAEKVKIGEVFEGLNPPDNLEALQIEGFFGCEVPSYFMTCSLDNLNWLRLDDCKFLKRLPPLGQLPHLKALHIWGADSVSKIESDFFAGRNPGAVGFPSLQEFYLKGMIKLKKMGLVKPGTLPRLQKLHVIRCPKLVSLPDGLEHLSKLTHLWLEDVESIESITNLKSISELKLTNNSKLNLLSGLQSLKSLTIRDCHALEKVDCSHKLIYLSVFDNSMASLPRWLSQISPPRGLDLKGSPDLLRRCDRGGPEWPLLQNILRVTVRTVDGSSFIS